MTQEMLTPSFFATSLALTSWRMGLAVGRDSRQEGFRGRFHLNAALAHLIQTDRLDMSSI